MNIKFNILDRQFFKYQKEYEGKALEVLRSGWYILGKEVENFEKEFAEYNKAKYCVGVANGLDALVLAVRALGLGKGDEIIIQGNTYIASLMGATVGGAKAIFVEPNKFYNIDSKEIEKKITDKTKAILVTHLYGQSTEMEKIMELCKHYGIYLIEDCAQAHGAEYNGKKVGTFGIGCFSFYPSKNLGCFGDGGAIVTDNPEIVKKLKMLRNYGSHKKYYNQEIGMNSRLDEIQAGLLRVKLKYLDTLNLEREALAMEYLNKIKNKNIVLPEIGEKCTHVWHLFVVRCKSREKLQTYLLEKGIETAIHYPIPPHLSEAYRHLKMNKGDLPITEQYAEETLSLPLYNGMQQVEIEYVIEKLNEYVE